jgi:hypothetical protein
VSSDVRVGQVGWLFLSGGSNEVFRYFTEEGFFASRDAWMQLLSLRKERGQANWSIDPHS